MSPARRNRLILIAVLAFILGAMLYVARAALFPYALGLVVAYLVLPAVNLIDRHMPQALRERKLARPLAILLVYLIGIVILVGFVAFLVPVISGQVEALWENRDTLVQTASDLVTELGERYRRDVRADFRQALEEYLSQITGKIASLIQTGLTRTLSAVTSTISFVLGFIVVPFWLFYILNDQVEVSAGLVTLIPERWEADVRNLLRITDDIFSAYIRGQFLLCLFVGIMATVGLMLAGVPYALVLGLVAGVFELIPYIGPLLGAVPGVIVAALDSWPSAGWAVLVFFVIQQIENLLLVPRISGRSVRLHPALVMVVLVVGNEAAGLWGMLLAVPVTALIRRRTRWDVCVPKRCALMYEPCRVGDFWFCYPTLLSKAQTFITNDTNLRISRMFFNEIRVICPFVIFVMESCRVMRLLDSS
jgi:predicted PurR-regulated permease PerM